MRCLLISPAFLKAYLELFQVGVKDASQGIQPFQTPVISLLPDFAEKTGLLIFYLFLLSPVKD